MNGFIKQLPIAIEQKNILNKEQCDIVNKIVSEKKKK